MVFRSIIRGDLRPQVLPGVHGPGDGAGRGGDVLHRLLSGGAHGAGDHRLPGMGLKNRRPPVRPPEPLFLLFGKLGFVALFVHQIGVLQRADDALPPAGQILLPEGLPLRLFLCGQLPLPGNPGQLADPVLFPLLDCSHTFRFIVCAGVIPRSPARPDPAQRPGGSAP